MNLPGHIVKDIEAGLGQPSKKLFVAAQSVIWRLINADTFPKFLQSPEYKMVMFHLLSRAPVKRVGRRGQKRTDRSNADSPISALCVLVVCVVCA